MFTGLVEETGTVKKVCANRLEIEAETILEDLKIGDSVSVNGVCLTVSAINGKIFSVDMTPETRKRTTLAQSKVGDNVNLERALRLSDRLGGHFVTGHVDGIGMIVQRERKENSIVLSIQTPEGLNDYLIERGAVAVDGVSLTVQDLSQTTFKVAIIPQSAKITTLGAKSTGVKVNVEVDVLGKYVKKFLDRKSKTKSFFWEDYLEQIKEGG